jgi:septal ring factor EnvC (AmiA/AmiB activator)
MWPRLLEQLLDLLPHVTRLVPLADRYFTSRSAAERTHAEDLSSLQTALGDLLRSHDRLSAELAAHHPTLDRLTAQLASQTAQLDHILTQADHTRADLLFQATQLQTVTRQLNRLQLWAIASAILSALLLLAILLLLLLRAH